MNSEMASPHITDMTSLSCDSEDDFSLVSLPCHTDDTTIPADGYCNDCHEHQCHTKATPCRQHEQIDKDAMPSTQPLPDTSEQTGPKDNLTTPCPGHNEEILQFYCHDHRLLLCSKCVSMEHTKPCHVDCILEISDKMIDSRDYNKTMDRIDKLLEKCSTIKTETSRDTNKSNDSLQNASLELSKYREEINKRIDELHKEIETKINTLEQQNDERKKSAETIYEDVLKIVKVTYDSMKQLNTSKQANQLFMEVKEAQKQLDDYEESISSIQADNSIDEYEFLPSQAVRDVLKHEKMLGDISIKHGAQTGSSTQSNPASTSAYETITPTNQHEICVKVAEDKQKCWVTGMTALPPGRLVLADYNNNSIKLVDVNSKLVTSQLSLGGKYADTPCDITSTTSTQVAVTIPDRQIIQFISVTDKLSLSHAIQTDGNCSHICCHQNKLIVTYGSPVKLEILDMKGRVITRVKTDSTGNTVFNQPTYVEANSSAIYVCDVEHGNVIMLNWQGEITGRFEDLEDLAGLALLGDGSLLVCDYSSNILNQVSGDCSKSRIVLKDVRCPLAVCVDAGGHKLYITRYTKNYGYIDNSILGYKI